jgi:phosphoribosylamine--glycine ligase
VEKRRFLFLSLDGLITDIAWQISKEGHEVKYFIENSDEAQIGDGFISKVTNWESEVEWADVIVFDDVLGQGEKASELRAAGKHVIGGSAYTDRLEDDRTFGQEELRKHDINVLPFHDFTNFDEAIAFVRSNPGRHVIKPSGEAQNIKRLLFVGQEDDGRDVIDVLTSYRNLYSDKVKQFQLQKRVTGVEIAVGAFFNGERFLSPINVNFEHKKLFPGDLGPPTGEMGTLMYWSKPNRIFNQTLKKLEPTLRREGYTGYLDLNCIVNGNGIYPLEFTARFGYPTISIQQEGLITPIGEFLWRIASGSDEDFKTKAGFQIGVRIVVPPFPFDDPKTFEVNSKDRAIVFRKPVKDGIHIEDVRLENDEWMITGTSGVVLVAVGTGNSVRQAQTQVYNRIKNILIPNMYYRTDIGNRWFEDCDRLHTWGYLRDV